MTDSHETDDAPLYIETDGHLTWTDEGIREWRVPFGKAGIDIRTVTTRERLRDALTVASPYLDQELIDIARNGPMSLERQALVAIATDDKDEYKRLCALLDRRERLGLRIVQ